MADNLRRQLKRAAGCEGSARPVQVAGGPMERRSTRSGAGGRFAAARSQPRRRVEDGRYALVLHALAPAATQDFVAHGAAAQLVAPTVGAVLPAVELATALAGTLAGWLEIHTEPVALAPPLLHTDRRWRVADLGLDWPLSPPAPAAL